MWVATYDVRTTTTVPVSPWPHRHLYLRALPHSHVLLRFQGVFFTYGALGLAWLALWLPLVPNENPYSLSAGASQVADGSQLPQQPPQEEDSRLASASLPATELPAVVPATKSDGAQLSAPAAAVNGGPGENNLLAVETVALAEGAGTGVELSFRNGVSASDEAVASGEDKKEGTIDGPPLSREGGVLGGFRDVPWKEYATNGQIWSIAAAHMSHNWGLYVMLAWLPTYFNQVRCRSLRCTLCRVVQLYSVAKSNGKAKVGICHCTPSDQNVHRVQCDHIYSMYTSYT